MHSYYRQTAVKILNTKKPSPHTLKAQLKLHKTDFPIRPVINNRSAPSYKLAKHLAKILNQYSILNNHYNVVNLNNLAFVLTKIKVHENRKIITFGIEDLYVNIPTNETLYIIKKKHYWRITTLK